MKAVKIKMKPYSYKSDDLLEIDEIYITGCDNPGFFKKEVLHDFLKGHPGTIQVDIYPYPNLIPEVSVHHEKYVRSAPDWTTRDNLLSLPRV